MIGKFRELQTSSHVEPWTDAILPNLPQTTPHQDFILTEKNLKACVRMF
jgi:hypothetical protein